MCSGARLLRIRGNDGRSALMCFDFEVFKNIGEMLKSPFQINLQGP